MYQKLNTLILLQNVGGITTEQARDLYDMNFNNWKSACTRDSLLWGKCIGNAEYEHFFNYFGTPDKYKLVIINNDTGETKVSNVVNRKDFTSYVTIDYNTMKVSQHGSIINILITLFTTILVEIIVAFIMKMKNTKIIIATNLVSNIILQLILILGPVVSYWLKFIFMEILVVLFEFLIYKKYMKNQSHNKILLYTLIANILTAFLTFI